MGGPARRSWRVPCHTGGIRGLERFLTENWEALEADFQAHYRIDLRRALWADRMGVRRFGSLVRGLPVSARLYVKDTGGWTVNDHLTATVAEQVNLLTRVLSSSVNWKRPPDIKPLVIPRPGPKADKPKPNTVSPAEFARRMLGA